MEQANQPIDEYTLAAFIAGTLSEQRRAEVIAYLARNEEAREIMRMAYDAMEVAGEVPVDEEPAQPEVRPKARIYRLVQYAVAAAVVIGVSLATWVALPDRELVRSAQQDEIFTVRVHPERDAISLQWKRVGDAHRYQVVVWDVNRAAVVAQYETQKTGLRSSDQMMRDLARRLGTSQTYSVRVDAIDLENRIVLSSQPAEFTMR